MSYTPGRRKGVSRRLSSNHQIDSGFSFSAASMGIGYALILAVILTVIASTVMYFTDIDEGLLFVAVNAGSFIILGLAAYITACRTQSYGLLYGLSIGFGYSLLTLVIGLIFFPSFLGFATFFKRLAFSLLAGAAGGILGVNS
jgi:putative membrane protein (TIGR04086 family)